MTQPNAPVPPPRRPSRRRAPEPRTPSTRLCLRPPSSAGGASAATTSARGGCAERAREPAVREGSGRSWRPFPGPECRVSTPLGTHLPPGIPSPCPPDAKFAPTRSQRSSTSVRTKDAFGFRPFFASRTLGTLLFWPRRAITRASAPTAAPPSSPFARAPPVSISTAGAHHCPIFATATSLVQNHRLNNQPLVRSPTSVPRTRVAPLLKSSTDFRLRLSALSGASAGKRSSIDVRSRFLPGSRPARPILSTPQASSTRLAAAFG